MNTIAKIYPLSINRCDTQTQSLIQDLIVNRQWFIHLHAKSNAVWDILCMWFLNRVRSAALVNKFEWCRAEYLFFRVN